MGRSRLLHGQRYRIEQKQELRRVSVAMVSVRLSSGVESLKTYLLINIDLFEVGIEMVREAGCHKVCLGVVLQPLHIELALKVF